MKKKRKNKRVTEKDRETSVHEGTIEEKAEAAENASEGDVKAAPVGDSTLPPETGTDSTKVPKEDDCRTESSAQPETEEKVEKAEEAAETPAKATEGDTTCSDEDLPAESEGAAESNEDGTAGNVCEDKPHKAKKSWRSFGRIMAVVLLSAALLFCLLAAGFVLYTTAPVPVEVDSQIPKLNDRYDWDLLQSLYQMQEPQIDVHTPGDYPVTFTFFGFIKKDMTVRVRDTRAPELVLYEKVNVLAGTDFALVDFVRSCLDSTGAELAFSGSLPDTAKAGLYTVSVVATDPYGNRTEQATSLQVWDIADILTVDLNTADMAAELQKRFAGITEVTVEKPNAGEADEYVLRAFAPAESYRWRAKATDTVAPLAEAKNYCLRLGEVAEAQAFVASVADASDWKAYYRGEPDFEQLGFQEVSFTVEDAFGNTTDLSALLLVTDFPISMTVELGTDLTSITEGLFETLPAFEEQIALAEEPDLQVGQHTLTYESTCGSYLIDLTVEDTTAPVLTLKNLSVFVGDTLTAENLVETCEDLSAVTYSWISAPSTTAPGKQVATVMAEDACGNKTSASLPLTVRLDTTPPVIYGVQNRTIVVGETVSFRKGVYAEDNRDGTVSVKVDSSGVNTKEVGWYKVIYTSTDAAGNVATAEAYLEVKASTMDIVYDIADNVLSWIITDNMSQREKAWAIYRWCTSNMRYSTRTDYLMGHLAEGAYSGFTTHSGNCYIYYAVAATLLTRAGIENLEVQRDDPAKPHYWSLVKIDGSWYHMDTCPHYAGFEIECFLLTDREVQAYSENQVADYYSFDSSLYPATP